MKSGSFCELDGKSMLCHMYAIRAYSRGTSRRQWIGTSGLIPMRRSTWIRSMFASASCTWRICSMAFAESIDCCMMPTSTPSATT